MAPRQANAAKAGSELEALLAHTFRNPALLTLALTHRSFVFDGALNAAADLRDPSLDNEQFEFLGDAVLGMIVAHILCERFPAAREGELTRLRASVVSSRHLGAVGTRLGLGRWLRLGQTAERNHARTNAALFANTVEALIAALYLDAGLDAARAFIVDHVLAGALPEAGASLAGPAGDFKSALQERMQAAGDQRPQYRTLSETGPDHARVFRVEVRLEGDAQALATAESSSRKQAEQEAARLALAQLDQAGAPA